MGFLFPCHSYRWMLSTHEKCYLERCVWKLERQCCEECWRGDGWCAIIRDSSKGTQHDKHPALSNNTTVLFLSRGHKHPCFPQTHLSLFFLSSTIILTIVLLLFIFRLKILTNLYVLNFSVQLILYHLYCIVCSRLN